MDAFQVTLLNRIASGGDLYEISMILFANFILTPFISWLIEKIKNSYNNSRLFTRNINKIVFIGYESFKDGIPLHDYPYPMYAIFHFIYKNEMSPELTFSNKENNGIMNSWYRRTENSSKVDYIIKSGKDIDLENGIIVNISTHIDDKNNNVEKIVVVLSSSKMSCDEISEFVDNCIDNYMNYESNLNKDKLYHFIFTGRDANKKIEFRHEVLSVLNDPINKNYETFDHVFSDNKEHIIKDLQRLSDVEYYKRTGKRRKLGYLFYGPPGCGKTSFVQAIANETKRHIIEVPFVRIKTNQDIEEIFNVAQINDIKIEKDKIIILFDEIDTGSNTLATRDGETIDDNSKPSVLPSDNNDDKSVGNKIMSMIVSSCENTDSKDDKINIGPILSRLDGIGNYNGIIFVATTNFKEKISPSLFRNGRLDPIYFGYINKKNIALMIEKYFDVELDDSQIDMLPDESDKIPPVDIRKYIDLYEDDLDGLLDHLESLKSVTDSKHVV